MCSSDLLSAGLDYKVKEKQSSIQERTAWPQDRPPRRALPTLHVTNCQAGQIRCPSNDPSMDFLFDAHAHDWWHGRLVLKYSAILLLPQFPGDEDDELTGSPAQVAKR